MGSKAEVLKEVVEVTPQFELPNKKVYVQYIKRRTGMASGDHITEDHVISGGMLLNSTRRYTLPLKRNGSLANILNKEQKAFLEKKTGLNLSIYDSFWNDFVVTLRKTNNPLDLSDPMDYISYLILLSLTDKIAPTWAERGNKLSYEFVIVEEGAELKEVKRKYDSKKEAFKLYGKIEDDREKLLGVLKLLTNKPFSKGSKMDWIQTEVESYIDQSPSNFVAVMKDSALATKLLIHEAVDLGVVVKKSNEYITADGLELCDADETPTFSNAVRFLDNDKNQEIRSLVEAKMNNAK